MGQLVFQATAGGQTALVGPNPSSNFSLNVPAVNGTLVTTGDTGTVTNTMLASNVYTAPGTIGSGTPNTGAFTTLSASTSITNSSLTSGRVIYTTTGGLETASANMTFNGTSLTLANDASISGLTVGKGTGSNASNTVVGYQSLNTNGGASNQSAFGYQALYLGGGGQDTAVGYQAGYSANISSAYATYIGYKSGYSTTTGTQNTAIGNSALYSNTTASNNTAVGYQAGYANTVSTFNTFIGQGAGYSFNGVSGNGYNCFVGAQAGYSQTTGQYNSYLGLQAGYYMTTGARNTIIGGYTGNQGGLDIRTASNYIVLSDGDGNPRQVIDGSGNVGIGTASPTTGLEVSNANLGTTLFTNPTTSGATVGAGIGFKVYNGTSVAQNGSIFATSSTWSYGTYSANQLNVSANGAGGVRIATATAPIVFNTGDASNSGLSAERMRIDSSGTLCVGVSGAIASNVGGISVKSTVGNGYPCLNAWNTTAGTSGAPTYFCYFGSGSSFSAVGSITNNGTTTLYNSTSDQRLKENIITAGSGLDKISNIKIRSFNWIENKQFVDFGVIAQEINNVAPEAVSEGEDNKDGTIKTPWQVDTSALVPAMIKAIQELSAQVTTLQAQVTALQGK